LKTSKNMDATLRKILVIDDNADNLLSLKAMIADLFSGIETYTATSGPEGIVLAKKHQPELILLDILMPGMDGFEVCNILKEDEALRDIPVVFVTALKENKENKMRALEAGAEGFLTKPVDEQELVAHINAMHKIKEANDFKKSEQQRLEQMVAERTKELENELRQKLELNKRLAESEERFRELFERAPLGYQSLDSDGRFIEVNESWLETLGYKREEVIGKWFGDFLAPEYVDAFRERFPKFKALGIIHSEFYMIHKDGNRKYIAFDGRIGHNMDGSFKQTHCILKDETERKRAEEMLAESTRMFRLVVENITDGIWLMDLSFNTIWISPSVTHSRGYTLEELQMLPLDLQCIPESVKLVEKAITLQCTPARLLDPSVNFLATMEIGFLCKNGSVLWTECTYTVIRDAEGKPQSILGVGRNITERKQAEEAKRLREEQLQKQNNALLALMSKGAIFQADLQQAITEITAASAELIGTERVSVWLYNDDFSEIKCTKLYNGITHQHISNGQVLCCEDFPAYFACQKKGEVIDAVDVFTDPRTCELPAAYYKEHNIRSMLDMPVWFHDRLGAVLCFEHTGEQRVWTPEDVRLATSMAALLSLCFQNEERRQAEDERESAMLMLQSALAQSPSGILIADAPHVRIRWANEVAMTIRGDSETPLTGIDVSKHSVSWQTFRLDGTPMPSEELPLSRAILKGETVRNEEVIIRNAKGEDRYVSANSAPIRNAAGDITAGIVVFHDITERKRAEEALRESSALLERSQQIAHVGSWKFDVPANRLDWSDEVFHIFGCEPQEFGPTYEAFLSFVHPDDRDMVNEAYTSSVQEKRDSYEIEHRIVRKFTGEVRFVHERCIHEFDAVGAVIRSIGMVQDITERRQAEAQIRFQADIIDNSPIIAAYHDKDLNMVWANRAYQKATGLSLEEIKGRKCYQVWNLSKPCRSCPVITAIETGENAAHELTPYNQDHWPETQGYWLSEAAPVRDEEGTVIGAIEFASDISQSKRAENQLRKLSQAVEQSPATVIITNPDGDIEYVNPKFIEATGYTWEEVIGQNPRILKSGEQTKAFYKEMWDMITSGNEWRGEIHNKKKSGELYWESALISPIKDEKGEIVHYLAVKEDITERKKDQEKIRITKDTYESIFNSVSEAIYVLDEKGHFIDVNRGAEIMYGYTRDELIGKSLADVSAHGMNDLDAVGKVIGNVAQTGVSQSFEFWGQRKNGEVFPKDVSISRGKYFGKDYIIATARDITDRKKAETARSIQYTIARAIHTAKTTGELLEIVRQELSRLFDTSNFFVAMYNPEKDTLKQLLFHDEMDSYDEWDANQSISGQVVKSGKTIFLRGNEMDSFSREHKLEVLGTNSACWLGVPIKVNNQVSGVMVIQHYTNPEAYSIADVSLFEMVAHETGIYLEMQLMIENLIKAKDQAEESDRLKSAFLANMSHEIRTPMNGILGFAELLKEPDLTGEEKEGFIAMINKSGQRMLNIINDIVDISKIEAGLTEVRIAESNINDQLDYIHNFFKPEAVSKGLEFSLRHYLASKDATIQTDREKLYAILTNLVKNAIKYTHTGKIELGCVKKAETIEFYVKDTGIGIPKDRQEAIFERFIQADIEDRMALQGAGLGLAISKAYVELLGGSIWVESEEGKGSAFYFTLPCPAEPEMKNFAPLPQATESTGKIRKLKTLIVEDDETSELLLTSILSAFSNEILVAHTGLEAIALCRSHSDIDLILMDVRMPEMGGYEASKLIREFNQNVIIIAQTAFGLSGDREKSLAAGCNDYLAKPISINKLQTMIQKYFG